MARIVFSAAIRRLTGGVSEVEVEARNVRELLRRLEERFPGISRALESGTSIAIDGDIIQDALLEEIGPASEVHFLPAVQGG